MHPDAKEALDEFKESITSIKRWKQAMRQYAVQNKIPLKRIGNPTLDFGYRRSLSPDAIDDLKRAIKKEASKHDLDVRFHRKDIWLIKLAKHIFLRPFAQRRGVRVNLATNRIDHLRKGD